MPIFLYKAKKPPREIINGELEAASQDEAVNHLNALGLVPISLVPKDGSAGGALAAEPMVQTPILDIKFMKLKTRDVDIFTRQLASLIRAGVPILRALSLIYQQTEEGGLKKVAGTLEKQIQEGRMFSQALLEYPRIFNRLYINMVRSGEQAGVLDEVLYSLAEYREKEQEIRNKVQAALAYPLLTAVVGVITVFVMLTFFMPKFVGLFEHMNRALPLSTQILIGVTNFMSAHWPEFLMGLFFMFVLFGRVKEGSKKKALFDFIKLHLPLINKFVRDAEVAKFARTLSVLIKHGISVVDGLELATDVLDNTTLKEGLKKAREEIIQQGSSLSSSLKKIDVFPSFAVNMVAVGEEGGKLGGALKEVSDLYEREVEQGTKIITSLLEPILILAIGVVVGFIVFAMLLPIFDIEMTVH